MHNNFFISINHVNKNYIAPDINKIFYDNSL